MRHSLLVQGVKRLFSTQLKTRPEKVVLKSIIKDRKDSASIDHRQKKERKRVRFNENVTVYVYQPYKPVKKRKRRKLYSSISRHFSRSRRMTKSLEKSWGAEVL